MSSIFLRIGVVLFLATMATWLCLAQAQVPEKQSAKLDVKDSQLTELVSERAKLVRATSEPHRVYDRSMTACLPNRLPEERRNKKDSPHTDYALLVYLTHNGREMMTSGKGIYPVGTTIIKEKMHPTSVQQPPTANQPNTSTKSPSTPELFTGMLKREAGYNPACGDWEFSSSAVTT